MKTKKRMLILSGRKALLKQCDGAGVAAIETAIADYCQRISDEYFARFQYYDDPTIFTVKPAKKNAKAIRNLILDTEKKWGTIDYILIIGGDAVVPFFRLPNPCDDSDAKVVSDSPYASRDDDFLIPERVCARIPDNKSADFIIKQLNKPVLNYPAVNKTHQAFGLTAKVWLKASQNVYRQIGKIKDLKVSPPVTSDKFEDKWLQDKDFIYFNVHGSDESANWYGQDGDDYPVALSPDNIIDASGIVASEACYGANIIKRTSKNAICLRYMDQDNILCFCGSTTIAYGPSVPPSSEADLLVKYFFEYVKQGLPVGACLLNAKRDFARKALRRHGFLDDDDQKTLLQFVLYGDPTLRISPALS